MGGHKLRKQMYCDCHKMKNKPSEQSIPCGALAAARGCYQGKACRVVVCEKHQGSSEATLWTTKEEDVFSLVSALIS